MNKKPVDAPAIVESKRPILLGLSLNCKPVGFMRITDCVAFSLYGSTWVDHDEGVCVNGMNMVWDGAVVI